MGAASIAHAKLSLALVVEKFSPRCKCCNQVMSPHGYGYTKKTGWRHVAYVTCVNKHCPKFQVELAFDVSFCQKRREMTGREIKIDWR